MVDTPPLGTPIGGPVRTRIGHLLALALLAALALTACSSSSSDDNSSAACPRGEHRSGSLCLPDETSPPVDPGDTTPPVDPGDTTPPVDPPVILCPSSGATPDADGVCPEDNPPV